MTARQQALGAYVAELIKEGSLGGPPAHRFQVAERILNEVRSDLRAVLEVVAKEYVARGFDQLAEQFRRARHG